MSFDENVLYDLLVDDICGKEKPEYDNLVIFVHNLLYGYVISWCSGDDVLRGGRYYEDVMQEIQIRIMQKSERDFFGLEEDRSAKSCEEFKAWCYVVARNYFLTFCVKQKSQKKIEQKISQKIDVQQSGEENPAESLEIKESHDASKISLADHFQTVMDLKSSPHIVLTWLAISLYMLACNLEKIESTHMVVESFSEKKLFEMFDFIVEAIKQKGLISLDDEKILKQREKLYLIHQKTGKRLGDMRYEEFYMSKGPEMSISDWVNRINSQIKNKSGD